MQQPSPSPSRQQNTIATPKQIQSILKKFPSQPSSQSQPSSSSPRSPTTAITPTASSSKAKTYEDRAREIALYHAHLLQQRKDIELEILLSLETLIEYPLSQPPTYTAACPSPTDATTFKRLLTPFTPSDYDALIEERNINEHCGYALCPNPRLRESGGGAWRLLGTGGKAKDFRVVRKEELEMWCGDGGCKRRALYVRVQLSESPAWERGAAGIVKSGIDLLDEPKERAGEDVLMEGIERLDLHGEGRREWDERDLAMERGDTGMGSKGGLVNVKVLERDVKMNVQPPTLGEDDLSGKMEHLALEGYTSKFGEQRKRMLEVERHGDGDDMDEDDFEESTDWKF